MGCCKSRCLQTRKQIPSFALDTNGSIPRTLTSQELSDVKCIINTLRDESKLLDAVGYMFSRLFRKSSEVKQMFTYSAFLDPECPRDCVADPWFQGFLKAYVNSLVKFVAMQDDEKGMKALMEDFEYMHERVKGVKRVHLEIMTNLLSEEIMRAMAGRMDKRHRISWNKFMIIFSQAALSFLPIQDADITL